MHINRDISDTTVVRQSASENALARFETAVSAGDINQ
jgi:hypothetical protein